MLLCSRLFLSVRLNMNEWIFHSRTNYFNTELFNGEKNIIITWYYKYYYYHYNSLSTRNELFMLQIHGTYFNYLSRWLVYNKLKSYRQGIGEFKSWLFGCMLSR